MLRVKVGSCGTRVTKHTLHHTVLDILWGFACFHGLSHFTSMWLPLLRCFRVVFMQQVTTHLHGVIAIWEHVHSQRPPCAGVASCAPEDGGPRIRIRCRLRLRLRLRHRRMLRLQRSSPFPCKAASSSWPGTSHSLLPGADFQTWPVSWYPLPRSVPHTRPAPLAITQVQSRLHLPTGLWYSGTLTEYLPGPHCRVCTRRAVFYPFHSVLLVGPEVLCVASTPLQELMNPL